MERGPMALFGALVAVGLGPALWLGVQIGSVSAPAIKPPVVQSEQKVVPAKPPGGAGAGAAPAETEAAPQPKRKARYVPADKAPKATPSRSTEADDEATAEPSAEPAPTEEETTQPPGDDTGEPDDPAGDGDDEASDDAPLPPDQGGSGAGVQAG